MCILVLVVVAIASVFLIGMKPYNDASSSLEHELDQPLHVLSPAVAKVVSASRLEVSHLYDAVAAAKARKEAAAGRASGEVAPAMVANVPAAQHRALVSSSAADSSNSNDNLATRTKVVAAPPPPLREAQRSDPHVSTTAGRGSTAGAVAASDAAKSAAAAAATVAALSALSSAAGAGAESGSHAGGGGGGGQGSGQGSGREGEEFRLGQVVHESWAAWVDAGKEHGDMATSPAVQVVTSGGGGTTTTQHLPYFSIIGAQKAGTTYLRWLLVQVHAHREFLKTRPQKSFHSKYIV
jgi:hypothetical protein